MIYNKVSFLGWQADPQTPEELSFCINEDVMFLSYDPNDLEVTPEMEAMMAEWD